MVLKMRLHYELFMHTCVNTNFLKKYLGDLEDSVSFLTKIGLFGSQK